MRQHMAAQRPSVEPVRGVMPTSENIASALRRARPSAPGFDAEFDARHETTTILERHTWRFHPKGRLPTGHRPRRTPQRGATRLSFKNGDVKAIAVAGVHGFRDDTDLWVDQRQRGFMRRLPISLKSTQRRASPPCSPPRPRRRTSETRTPRHRFPPPSSTTSRRRFRH